MSVGETVGDSVGSGVGVTVWWLQSPELLSKSPATSTLVVENPARQAAVSKSQPHWMMTGVSAYCPSTGSRPRVTLTTQSAEHPNCRQMSAVGETVGTVDGGAVGGTVGGTVGESVLQPAQVNAHMPATAGDSLQSPFATSRRQVERLTSSLSWRSSHIADGPTVGSAKVGVGDGFKVRADVGSAVVGVGVGVRVRGTVGGGAVLDVG